MWHEQNLRSWGELIFFRDILEAFARRRLRNTRFATLEESHRRSLFHRSAQVKFKKLRPPSPFWDLCAYFPNQLYAILTWTAVGMMFFISTRPKTEEELAMKVMWGLYKNLKAKKTGFWTKNAPRQYDERGWSLVVGRDSKKPRRNAEHQVLEGLTITHSPLSV